MAGHMHLTNFQPVREQMLTTSSGKKNLSQNKLRTKVFFIIAWLYFPWFQNNVDVLRLLITKKCGVKELMDIWPISKNVLCACIQIRNNNASKVF